jgi:hypothetical protein
MPADAIPTPVDRPATGQAIVPAVPSPTGTPYINPEAYKWAGLAAAVILAVLGVLAGAFPESKGLTVALQIAGSLAALLGIASPGLRRAAPLIVVAVLGLSLTGCVKLKPWPSQAIDCGKAEVASLVPGLLADVGAALFAAPCSVQPCAGWDTALDRLVAKGGDAALCAVRALVADLESGTAGGAGPGLVGVSPSAAVARGEAYLAPYRLTGSR